LTSDVFLLFFDKWCIFVVLWQVMYFCCSLTSDVFSVVLWQVMYFCCSLTSIWCIFDFQNAKVVILFITKFTILFTLVKHLIWPGWLNELGSWIT
jgi:hypothetical protein